MATTYLALPDNLETRLNALVMLVEQDPDYFDRPECPYSEDLKAHLRKLTNSGPGRALNPLFGADDGPEERFQTVLAEVERTIDEFRSIEAQLSTSEPSDRINYVKAKTQLLERWISQKERIFTMREMSEFQRLVLWAVDELLDKDQQQELKARLNKLESMQ